VGLLTAGAKQTTQEELIYQKETDYLENTPGGNIITGFDNYIKGGTGAAAQRRKTGLMDANRVFSRSSISYGANSVSRRNHPWTAVIHADFEMGM
jgi:chromatin modification-related protein EAF6